MKRAELGGLALPARLTPVSRTREFERDGRFHFDVEISHPLVGLIELDCQILTAENQTELLVVFTAKPGTEDAEKLALLRVIGTQSFAS